MVTTTEVILRQASADYIALMMAVISDFSVSDQRLKPLVSSLRQIDYDAPLQGPFERHDHDGLRYLETLAHVMDHDDPSHMEVIHRAIKHLDWSPVYGGAGMHKALADGLFTAQAAGNYGGFKSADISAGLFLLAPGLHYPFHTHEAAEIYYCVAGEITVQQGLTGAPQLLQPGDYSFTPPHRLHALATHDQPALLAYSWHGDLQCETWWWAEQVDGSFQRTAWRRPPGEAWQPYFTEAVSDERFREAHHGLT